MDSITEFDDQNSSYSRIWNSEHVVADFETDCCRVQVLDTPDFGRTIFLDGEVQSSAADQEFYHDALVAPAFICGAEQGRNVLIVGGGELCTLKAVLRFPTVEHVTMIDYDGGFVDWCKENLVSWHGNCWRDERVSIEHSDIYGVLQLWANGHSPFFHKEPAAPLFDTIVVDMTDVGLAPAEFDEGRFITLLEGLDARLAADGTLTMYVGMWIPHKSEVMKRCVQAARECFIGRHVQPYRVYVPSFGTGEALFLMVSKYGWNMSRLGWSSARHFRFEDGLRSVLWSEPADWSAAE
jgi:spermidine synthase